MKSLKRALVLMAHPNHGGIMRSLATLDDAAARFGWELRFVFPAADEQVAAAGLRARARHLPGLNRWRRLSGRVRLPVVLATLVREVRREQINLIYSATLSSFPYGYLTARACGIGVLVHIYSSYGVATPYRKYWLRRARHAIAPSRDSLDLAAAAVGGFAGRARVVYNGVDISSIEAAATPPARPDGGTVPAGSPLVGMVANMDRRKNPLALVEATAQLVRRVPGVRVLLIGSFPDDGYRWEVLGRAQELGVAANVVEAGFQANPFPFVAACDVIVLPARRDPFPIALLEAMALGKPVVATAVGGIPEMIADGETGFVVTPNDIDALAARLLVLLEDPQRRVAMGQAARNRLVECFSLEAFLRQMFAAFEEAVETR
jgi:glycosyltransferase involved in cell wall biosynthesis